MKLSKLRISSLSANSLYNYALNQVYKSKLDLINFSFVESPLMKVKLLNRISNENCKIVDFCTLLTTIDTSESSLAYTIPAVNIIQNFFSKLNQDGQLYHMIIQIEQNLAKHEFKDLKSQDFIYVLRDDFELRNGIHLESDIKTRISNDQAKAEELSLKFAAPLTYESRVIILPFEIYERLPLSLQNNLDIQNENIINSEKKKLIKVRLQYHQLMQLFLSTADHKLSREIFHVCLTFPNLNRKSFLKKEKEKSS
jgi:Zn-dependent oligopeptidase